MTMAAHLCGRREAPSTRLLAVFLIFSVHLQFQISVAFVRAVNNVYIVYMGEKQHEDATVIENSHHEMLASLLGSKEAAQGSIVYSYKHGFSGFAARLTQSQAEMAAEHPGVLRVIPNRIHKLQTTRSWDFLGLHSQSQLLSDSKMGEGIIIGVIDSGVWPELESFSDKDMGPIPSHWKGICQHGQLFNSTNCNRKLIGARWFLEGVMDESGRIKNITDDFLSPRDGNGHGTHTASTAAGSLVKNASYRGLARGVARGGAPHAHLAIYKVCWAGGRCSDADILKAFDEAIHDGVDVISGSLGGAVPLLPYVEDNGISIGSFHAVAKGIMVVCAAGNEGPASQTVDNTAPWILNVAATTIDRAYPTAITLGNNRTLLGQSMDTKTNNGFNGLVYSEQIAAEIEETFADDGSKGCKLGSLNATSAEGKVVLCFSVADNQDLTTAAASVFAAGGIGLIYAQPTNNLLTSCEIIPCIMVNYEVGTEIVSYIRRTRSPIVKLGHPKTVIGKLTSPRVAYFSSRGPSSISPAVLKPDIAAPGVSILAAYPPPSGTEDWDGFSFDTGTSMACPHVAGIAALIKSLHKDWTPAAIKSAIVTTASQTGTDGEMIVAEGGNHKPADPFDIGGGLINPNKATNPGLIYDMSTGDYVQFLCSMGYTNSAISNITKEATSCSKNRHSILNLNLPSISIPNVKKTMAILRTVTNVGPINSVYKALVQSPHGIKMAVKPEILSFNSSITKIQFRMTFSSTRNVQGDYSFGSLTWTDGEHFVRSPIVVRVVKFESYVGM
ncbi:subtilisin-like protease SBT3.9 [Tasmannia lanceolata]|uniref:subtilisin-like protease SBT3.9 n=1 Tax=Tasmannia lanceolata TaxID=3420 RepID=UPI004062BFF4